MVSGINVKEEMRLFNFDDYVVKGSALDLLRNNKGIILGAGAADKLSLKVGDKIQVGTITGGIIPLKIVGIFQTGLAEVDNVQSYVNLKMAQQLLGQGNTYISNIHIKLHDMSLAAGNGKNYLVKTTM